MKFKIGKKVNNIVYYSLTTKALYIGAGKSIVPYAKKINESVKIISTIPFDNLLKATVEVPKVIDEFEIDEFVVEAAYKQLSISLDSDYQVAYFKIDSGFDADNWIYDVYLVDTKFLEKSYEDIAAKTTFIDVISSIPFLPFVLYKTNKLDVSGNHVFVFISDNSGAFAFFSKGILVYAKSLLSSIHRLRVEFNQESALELNSIEFENLISGKSEYSQSHKSNIDSMLNKLSSEIEETFMYIKKVYQYIEPSCMYYGMNTEYSSEFLSFFRDTFLIDVQPFNSLSPVSTEKGYLALASISMTYADYLINNIDCKLPNFSHLKRPKPLTKRDSWQTVVIAGGLFILSLLYPLYNFAMIGYFSTRGGMLQSKYDNEIFPKAEQYRADEERMKQQIENLKEQKQKVDSEVATLRGNMSDIHNWQIGYMQKSKILDDMLKVANGSKVRVIKATAISNNNQHLVVELNLYARNQKDITDFIKILNEKGLYKSVITDKVERIALKTQEVQTPENTGIVDSIAKNAGELLNNNATKIDSISAKVDLSNKEELGKSVDGYLNSIVRVVVR